jgi:amidophosphoribosyltransferase
MSSFWSEDHLQEECGVFGCFSPKDDDVGDYCYLGLLSLQHRGQESAGISVAQEDCQVITTKGMGLIAQVFTREALVEMTGRIAVGHVRYSTTGTSNIENAQPFEGHCKLGHLSMAHNGTLVNSEILRSLMEDGGTVFQSTSDSEVILNLIARGSSKGSVKSVVDAMSAIKGSYALVLTLEGKLMGARDPYGLRPLCIGRKEDTWFLSSESCALNAVGAEFVRDVAPGEIVVLDQEGVQSFELNKKNVQATCVFEYIYFARPDSIIDGMSVYESRLRFGEELYKEGAVEADLVIGVPDSGIPAALGYSRASGIPFGSGRSW